MPAASSRPARASSASLGLLSIAATLAPGETKLRPHAALGPVLDRSATTPPPGQGLHDCEPEACPTRAYPSGASAREAVEEGRFLSRRQTWPFVEDGDPRAPVGLSPVDGHGRGSRRIVESVLDQVVQHDCKVFVGGLDDDLAVPREHELLLSCLRAGLPALLRLSRRVREGDWLA